MNKKVDRGECWDLVAFALNYAEAKWKAPLEFGTIVNHQKDELKPGDIMTFANTEFKPECCPSTYTSSTGCACITQEQVDYINQRGGNRTMAPAEN